MTTVISYGINGISFGALLFLLAAGLTLCLGLLKIVNLTHGSFYLIGSYITFTIFSHTHNWLVAVVLSSISVGCIGLLLYRGLLQRFAKTELEQVLLTFGCYFILADLGLIFWGGEPKFVDNPSLLNGSVHLGSYSVSNFRIMLILLGAVVAILLFWLEKKTRMGVFIRGGVDDEQMTEGVGINITVIKLLVFGLGALLAGLAGAVAVSWSGILPGQDMTVLLLSLIVVMIGGQGSLLGALVGSLIIGLVQVYSVALVPEFSLAVIYIPMIIVLVVKPLGMFGRG